MPNCVPCRWCGRPIIWVNAPTGRIPVENELTPFKRRSSGGTTMYTAEGARVSCEILPDSREREADGYAHRYHFCAKRPLNYKPPSKRELEREEYREFRAKMASEGEG